MWDIMDKLWAAVVADVDATLNPEDVVFHATGGDAWLDVDGRIIPLNRTQAERFEGYLMIADTLEE